MNEKMVQKKEVLIVFISKNEPQDNLTKMGTNILENRSESDESLTRSVKSESWKADDNDKEIERRNELMRMERK